jgi:hypothetical protein
MEQIVAVLEEAGAGMPVAELIRRISLAALERHVAQTGEALTEAQVNALEKKQDDDIAHGEIETAHPGYLDSQDIFYVGTVKGVGCIYQQRFVDTYSK